MARKKAVKKKPVAKKKNTGKRKAPAKKIAGDYRPTQTVAVISLLVNILLFPGLGTVIAGRTKTGIWQIILFGIGVILSIVLIGIPIVIAAWVWALVSSIQILQNDVKN